jgi:hypothetical protein
MSDGDLLRGWFTQFYPSNVPPAVHRSDNGAENAAVEQSDAAAQLGEASQFDWFIREGVIHGGRRGELLRAAAPSRLTYFRPLQDGETIRYEFLYEPGKHEVHPGLGRLAFLLEPGGVRLHWMVSGETEWTGLALNNATLEPLNRRGPRPLPLKPGEWNQVVLALNQDVLSLALNESEIYSRKLEGDNSRRFSLFHDRNQAAARVRNVVLRGGWPETLTAEERQDLLAFTGAVLRSEHSPDCP